MKNPKYLVFNYKSVVKILLAVVSSAVIFVACKKDSSIENLNPTPGTDQTVNSSEERVSAAATSTAPRAKAGNDQTITLPTNSVTLDGSGSYANSGSLSSYQWVKEVGPSATLASPTAARTAVTGMAGGEYRFRLTVTDNSGATGSDTVHVSVTGTGGSTNQPPSVNAGPDKTVTAGSSLPLIGTASDADGTIASYLWTKVSGNGGTITSPNASTTTITGLTTGAYVFSLKATDNAGASATDNVTVTVTAATNQAPTANAGSDKTITLPVNSTTLSGSGSDPDGTIASYLWSKVSGSGGTIASATSASTNITGLTAGSYVFSLKVTDNKGATATDNVTVTVNAATQTGGGGYAGYTQVYSTGYDDVNSIDPFGNGQWGSGSQADHLSTTIKKDGAGSFKSVPASVSAGIRSEVQYGSAQSPLEGIVEYDVYYDNFFANNGHSLQWHPTTSGGSGTGLYHKNGQLQFVTVMSGTSGTNVGSPFTVSTKTWHHIKLTYKFGSAGYIKVEFDGVEKVNSNIQMGDGSAPYLKVGVNMWVDQTSLVYYDNLKVYKKG